jgi:hypothetical protein
MISLIEDPRPWPFTQAELTAGLRRHTGEPSLVINDITAQELPHRRPSIGRIRALNVICRTISGPLNLELVLKEPQGTTRTGTAGAGRREVSFYINMLDQLPIKVPQLLAWHPEGNWLVFNLLPGGFEPERLTANEYRLAIEQLASLHDRFWGLGADLAFYPWLARPLEADFDIYLQAARSGLQRLVSKTPPNQLSSNAQLVSHLNRLVEHANLVAAALRAQPATLLHGDYWPGNLYIYPEGIQITYDWQQVAIGPGILDLLYFIQQARWHFDPLPISVEELAAHYRSRLAQSIGQTWEEGQWAALWDYALLWTFLTTWTDLLETIPDALLQTRLAQLETLWLQPVQAAVSRRLPEA